MTVKRIAWAFGCAKKDSDEESNAYRLLVERVAKSRLDRIADEIEHELYSDNEQPGLEYRHGWNDRARSIVRKLRGGL